MHRLDFKTIQNVQNIQHNTKQQKWSNYNELHRFDVKKSKERKTTKLRRKTFKTTHKNESDHIIIIASIWRQNDQNFWVRWQNYKSNQITMDCIDLTVKRSTQHKTTKVIKLQRIASIWCQKNQKNAKLRNYVAKHSKQRKTTKVIIL